MDDNTNKQVKNPHLIRFNANDTVQNQEHPRQLQLELQDAQKKSNIQVSKSHSAFEQRDFIVRKDSRLKNSRNIKISNQRESQQQYQAPDQTNYNSETTNNASRYDRPKFSGFHSNLSNNTRKQGQDIIIFGAVSRAKSRHTPAVQPAFFQDKAPIDQLYLATSDDTAGHMTDDARQSKPASAHGNRSIRPYPSNVTLNQYQKAQPMAHLLSKSNGASILPSYP